MDDPGQRLVDEERERIFLAVLKHPWHKPILQALAEGITRYADIRRTIEASAGDVLGEGQLSATLNRLRRLQVVDKQRPDHARPRWTLTAKGQAALRDVRYLEQVRVGPTGTPGEDVGAPETSPRPGTPAATVEVLTGRRQRDISLDDREALPEAVDTTVAHPARRYNYWLGGKDNFAADRKSGDEFKKLVPEIARGVQENRHVLRRAVHHLAAEHGIRQFLDIGAGLPTDDNTHEVAQRVAAEARVVYVDNDPLVMSHAQALLTSSAQGKTAYLEADLRDPETILNSETLRATLSLSDPVALVLGAVLHFIHGKGTPTPIVRHLMNALPPGSFLILTHATLDFASPELVAAAEQMIRDGRSDIWARPKEEISELFTGLKIIEPGIVPNTKWRPRPETPDLPLHIVGAWAGVGQKIR